MLLEVTPTYYEKLKSWAEKAHIPINDMLCRSIDYYLSYVEIIAQKVRAIQKDLRQAAGLTDKEAEIAVQMGLIEEEQKWWWTEAWQKGEREAEEDIEEGRVSPPMTTEEMRRYLGNA